MQAPHPLDRVQMSELDRAHAKAHMQRAELIIELVALGISKVRSVVALVRRAVAQRVKSFLFSAYR